MNERNLIDIVYQNAQNYFFFKLKAPLKSNYANIAFLI